MVSIKFPPKYTLGNFFDVCQLINRYQYRIEDEGSLRLDLSEITFIDPFGMVTLLSIGRHIFNTYGFQIIIKLPEGEAGSYMNRAGLDSLIDDFITVERSKVNIMNFLRKNENMGVLKYFDSEKDIMQINNEFESWMKNHNFTEYEINNLTTFVSEMIQNVCQHSKTKQKGIVCIQAYVSKKGVPFLSWAIGDTGIGIRESLIQSGVKGIASMTDERVLREVLTKGLSRHQDDITRGNGLHRLYQGAQKRKASLFIQSNSGLFGVHSENNERSKVETRVPWTLYGTNIGFNLEGQHLTSQ
ncbi:hypothetical protein [Paenibacillus xylanexedens]|nr:hypothetical protein [Paenibacillus xylanexedens]